MIISGGIDLSVGSLLALSGVLAAYGRGGARSAAVAAAAGGLRAIGLANGLLSAGPGSRRSS